MLLFAVLATAERTIYPLPLCSSDIGCYHNIIAGEDGKSLNNGGKGMMSIDIVVGASGSGCSKSLGRAWAFFIPGTTIRGRNSRDKSRLRATTPDAVPLILIPTGRDQPFSP